MDKIKSKSKCDMVVDEIIRLIADKIYRPGDKLPTENELVERFGVSRVTIRESLKKLNSMGVVSIRQGDGTFVKDFDLTSAMKPLYPLMLLSNLSAEQLYDARLYIEIGNASLAAKNCNGEMTEVKSVLAEMKHAIEKNDGVAFSTLDWKYHCLIGEASLNEVLMSAHMMIRDIVRLYIQKTDFKYEVMCLSLLYHERIVAAIESKNETLAGSLMKEHLEKSRDTILHAYNSNTRS